MNYLSLAGVLDLIGEPDRKPVIPLNLVADYAGASLHGALGIVLALFARERTGRGQHVDVSYLDTSVSLLAATPNMRFFFSRRHRPAARRRLPRRLVSLLRDLRDARRQAPDHRLHGAMALGELLQGHRPARLRASFARKPDQFVRAANAEEEQARQEIEAIIKTKNRDEWYDILVKADVCVGKVYDVEEMVKDPQITHRQMIVEADHPKFGKVKQFGIAIKLSDTPGSVRSAAPTSGEQTEDVLKSLGMTAEAIGDLRTQKVIE